MMNSAQHQAIPWVIRPPFAIGAQMCRVEHRRNVEVADRASRPIASQYAKLEARLSFPRFDLPTASPPARDQLERGRFSRLRLLRRRLVAERDQEDSGDIVPIFDPAQPHVAHSSMSAR